ncbi:ABC transporter [Gardnerella vaginalis]|uniref:ABC transporter n=1 Tax=Gardnerella vaginalis TaxID=2702 RepID=UPI0039F019A9
MINRCFAFVPGIKHLVVLRSACLAISYLVNIAFVYVCVGMLSPVLRPVRSTGTSLMSSVEFTSYIIALVAIILLKYAVFYWSCTVCAEIESRIAMRLRPKMLHAMLSLRSVDVEDSNYVTSLHVNEDIFAIQSFVASLVPQIIAAIPVPVVVSAVLFTVNPAIAGICALAALFNVASLIFSLALSPVSWRCVSALFAYVVAGLAIVATVWLSSVKGVGLAAALLTMPLLMLSVQPLRIVGKNMHVVKHAINGLDHVEALLKMVTDSPAPIAFSDDGSTLSLPDGSTNVALRMRCNISENNANTNEAQRLSIIAKSGELQVIPSKYHHVMREKILSGTGFNKSADILLSYSDRYDIHEDDVSPFVVSEVFDANDSASYLSLNDASSAALADIVTIVSERSHLFSTTLRENLLLAAPTATTTAMWDALRAVRIDGVVYADYDGLDMPIDRLLNNPEASYNPEDLKRRIILARAILRHTRVYVFDYSQCDISNHEAEEIVKILRRIARYANVIVLMPNDAGISSNDEIATVESYRHVANDSSKNITQLNKLNESQNSQNSQNSQDVEQAQQDSNKNKHISSIASIAYTYEVRTVSKFKRAIFAFISMFSTALNLVSAVCIPVAIVSAMFAVAGRPIFGFVMQQCVIVAVACMAVRALTLVTTFAGIDMHHERWHKAHISMNVGMIFAVVPLMVVLYYFDANLSYVAIASCVFIMFIVPRYLLIRSKHIANKVRIEQHEVENEVSDIELGIDEVLAFRQGEHCVNRMVSSMHKVSQQRMRLARKSGGMSALVLAISLISISVAALVVSHTIHPVPANIPAWSTVYAVMAMVLLVIMIQQVVDVVLQRIPSVMRVKSSN